MAAAWKRPAAFGCAAVLLLCGCTYSTTEPGLFPTPRPRHESPMVPGGGFKPQPTNPELPVAGERLWVSGFTELPITMRIAVHAVRRIEGATVLDWSITPIGAPGYEFGDKLPATELGLEPPIRRSPALTLVDTAAGRAYQPLAHRSRARFSHCLCTPLLRLKPDLRVGETRLLQIAFPALPESLMFVDVNLPTVTPFRHVPVSPVGTAPAARQPTDLARPGDVRGPRPGKIDFPYPSRTEQVHRIQVSRVLTAPGRATLEWSLTSLNGQVLNRVLDFDPPVAADPPQGVDVTNFSPASGPVLRVGSDRLATLWARTRVNNRTAYECQCTEIGLWASGLRNAGVSVGLVTNFAGLPPRTRTVDVEFPGFGIMRDVPVVALEDAAGQVGPAAPAETGRWTYSFEDPPYGWPTSEWPTDTPDPAYLAEFQGQIEPLVTLPMAR